MSEGRERLEEQVAAVLEQHGIRSRRRSAAEREALVADLVSALIPPERPKGERAIEIQLVRLKADGYSVPKGSLGYISGDFSRDGEASYVSVRWTTNPGPGGGSVPVVIDDLEPVGLLWVALPKGMVEDEVARAQIDPPDWLVRTRAQQMLHRLLRELPDDA